MHDLSNAKNIIAQSQIAQRVPSGVVARLTREPDASAPQVAQSEDPLGWPFGYTTSLDDLIKDGRQYGTIYAEPPWPCEFAPRPGSFFYRKPISRDVLAALPVRQLAAPWADVYLWAPDQFLQDAIQVLDAWGFVYTGSLVWIVPDIGADAGWGTVCQFLLLGVRCDSPSPKFRPRSEFLEARHLFGSVENPYCIKSIIEQVSPLARLHLFNEVVSMGWTSWGQRPRPFDPDEKDDRGPNEDDDWNDEICESEPAAQGDGLVADKPTIIDAAAEKSTRRIHS